MITLLKGKVVFVSGGTTGLGAAVARAAVREGAAVVVTGRRPEAGEKFVAELAGQGHTARFLRADIADVASARAVVVFLLSDRSGVVTGSVIDWDQTVIGSWD